MATTDLTTATFEQAITDNDIVLIDWWAAWCGPCRSFAPTYEAASEKHPDVVFGKVDTEAEQALAGAAQIMSMSTTSVRQESVSAPCFLQSVSAKRSIRNARSSLPT